MRNTSQDFVICKLYNVWILLCSHQAWAMLRLYLFLNAYYSNGLTFLCGIITFKNKNNIYHLKTKYLSNGHFQTDFMTFGMWVHIQNNSRTTMNIFSLSFHLIFFLLLSFLPVPIKVNEMFAKNIIIFITTMCNLYTIPIF